MRDYFEYYTPENGEGVFSRTCAGFIAAIDEENGTVAVSMEDFVGTRTNVELSFDYISSVGPGWFRFMPSIGDKVLLGFRPNNSIEILRYKAISYPQMAQFAKDSNPPFIFRKLKSGEFEIMSSGYAEIWGSKTGLLHLAGGLATLDLDRQTNSIAHNALLHSFEANGSQIKFGAVRRFNPLKTTADEAQVAPGIPEREFKVTLVQNIAGVTRKMYDATIGKVLDYLPALPAGIFTSRKHPDTAQNLVADINFYTVDGVQKVQLRVDELGNARLDLPASALEGMKLISALGSLVTETLNVKMSASNRMDLTGTTAVNLTSSVAINVDAPRINLGGTSATDSVGLASILTARIVAIETKLNLFFLKYNLHIHLPPIGGTPAPAFVELPIIPSPVPTGSTKVRVAP